MQLGVRNDEAAARAEAAGIEVIMNRCPKIEFGRLGGELSWSGVNSGIIRNRAPEPPTERKGKPRRCRRRMSAMVLKPVRSMPAPHPIPPRARASRRSSRPRPMFSTMSIMPRRSSICTISATSTARLTNPTVAVLEERIASLEGGRAAVAASSGHAAQFLMFATMMEQGDEFLASRNLYGGSLTQFGLSFKKLGWTCHFVDPIDPENFRRALTPRCKAIFLESLANPGGIIVDLEAVAKIAHEAGIPLIVDNTLATPYLCRPFEWGADLIVHSTTKFLDGHGNSLGGVVVELGKFDWSNGRQVPGADGAGTRLSRAALLREFRRFCLHHQGTRCRIA